MPTSIKTKNTKAKRRRAKIKIVDKDVTRNTITVEIDEEYDRIITLDKNYAPPAAGYTAMLTVKKNSTGKRTYFWVIASTKKDGLSSDCELESKIPPDVGAK